MKWARAALAVLNFLLEELKLPSSATHHTIAIAELVIDNDKSKTAVAVAYNVGRKTPDLNNILKRVVQEVLVAFEILADATEPFILVDNPQNNNKMNRHAEMQLIR